MNAKNCNKNDDEHLVGDHSDQKHEIIKAEMTDKSRKMKRGKVVEGDGCLKKLLLMQEKMFF